jgi:hypothetical protein
MCAERMTNAIDELTKSIPTLAAPSTREHMVTAQTTFEVRRIKRGVRSTQHRVPRTQYDEDWLGDGIAHPVEREFMPTSGASL